MVDEVRASWFEEMQSAWLYRRLAAVESDPTRRRLFTDLAAAAEHQAGVWARRLNDVPPAFRPSARARLVAMLLRLLGPRPMRPVLAAMKLRGLSAYDRPHVPGSHPMPTRVEQIGRRHRAPGGGSLRAAVFGVNDGLVSNTGLIMGIAGAGADSAAVLAGGIAGLLAGALSMAAGEYVSMRSQREMFEYQIGLERAELAAYPEEEAAELALIYRARGMDRDTARAAAADMLRDPEQALDALTREELGLNPDDLGSPWRAAASSFVAFGAGALVPLLPFLCGAAGVAAIAAAAAAAALGLALIGASLSLFTGRSAAWSALRMLLIGAGAGVVTYTIGYLLGGGVA